MVINRANRNTALILICVLFTLSHSPSLIAQIRNNIPVASDSQESVLLPESFPFKTNTASGVRKRIIHSSYYVSRSSELSPVDSFTFKYPNPGDTLWKTRVKYDWDENHWKAKSRFTYERNEKDLPTGWLIEISHAKGWVNDQRQLYRLSRGNIVLSVSQTWKDEKWNNSTKMDYIYDKNNNQRSWVSSYWANDRWYKGRRKYNHFNKAGYKDSIILQVHTGRPWYNSAKEIIRYDNNGNRIYNINYFYNFGIWIPRDRNTYRYNSKNQRIWRLYQRWSNDRTFFSTVNRHQYEYDSSGNLISELRSYHDSLGWHKEMLDSYQYDQNNNRILHLNQEFVDSGWNNLWQIKYRYNQDKKLIEELHENWVDNHWESQWREIQKFDADGYLLSKRQELWKKSSWNVLWIRHYYYEPVSGISSSVQLSNTKIPVYPNPCRQYVRFQIPGKSSEPCELRIYGINGREIAQLKSGENDILFDMQSVPAGVYLYNIQRGSQHYSGYFIKQ